MFRDRVVSMEQTLEGGEKHLPILQELCREALPELQFREYTLDHERDLFVMEFATADGVSRRVCWTRMVLFDAERIPTLSGEAGTQLRAKIVDYLRARSALPEIVVTFRHLEDGWTDTPEPRREGRRRRRGGRGRGAERGGSERRGAATAQERRPGGAPPERRPSGAPQERRPAGPSQGRRPGAAAQERRPGGAPQERRPGGRPPERRPGGLAPGGGLPRPLSPAAADGAPGGDAAAPGGGGKRRRRSRRRRRGRGSGGEGPGGSAPPGAAAP
jgi:hypothetical protein